MVSNMCRAAIPDRNCSDQSENLNQISPQIAKKCCFKYRFENNTTFTNNQSVNQNPFILIKPVDTKARHILKILTLWTPGDG